jgi:hypothetical protein
MTELTEIRMSGNQLVLNRNIVREPLLPRSYAELDRDVSVQGEAVVEGAVFARSLLVSAGPLRVDGAVFAQREIHVTSDCRERIEFRKSVATPGTVTVLSGWSRTFFGADINGASVTLRNAYVAANIFADDVVLENCVVLGGVFATQKLSLTNCVVGTFHGGSVRLAQEVLLLLPTAFSIEPIAMLPSTRVRNLALADLGALVRGTPEVAGSGWINMDIDREEQRTDLVDEQGNVRLIRSYSVAGKVLTADLLDLDKLQNHFLIAAGTLGAQTLRTYDIGMNADGTPVDLTMDVIADMLFAVMDGRIAVTELDGEMSFDELTQRLG